MFELKKISREAVPEALNKAERYRLLNNPAHAESICLDVLEVDPGNQRALVSLILALTDQQESVVTVHRAQEFLRRLQGDYEKEYYAGVAAERLGSAYLHQEHPGSGFNAYDAFVQAMKHYEAAERVRPQGNDDPILRWNTCARILMRNPELRERPEETLSPVMDE